MRQLHVPEATTQRNVQVPAECIPNEHCGTFLLDEQLIVFDKRVFLCDPPGIYFSQPIPDLFCHWHSLTLIMLNGYGIPMKHWDKLFKVHGLGIAQPGQWASVCVEWNNWKVHI
jgi:hypothetical protein